VFVHDVRTECLYTTLEFLRGDASVSERGRLTECLYTTLEFLREDASVSERGRLTECLYTTLEFLRGDASVSERSTTFHGSPHNPQASVSRRATPTLK